MREEKNEEFTPLKKFKSSNEKNDETLTEGPKNILTANKSETEAGSYFLGPVIKKYVRGPVPLCLARKKETDEYYLIKILVLDDSNTSDKCSLVRRTVFHNEYSILSLLKNCPGVIQLHDFFKDHISCEKSDKHKAVLKRVSMVLECLIPHGHHNTELIPLSHYLKEDRLGESEALLIFYNLLSVLDELHKRNVVHRDLKLSNIILNRRTLKVKLMDFYYARLLPSGKEVQGVPAQGAFPKTYDMWSAGVILYAMLNGYMPFATTSGCGSSLSSNRSLRDIYMKIMENDCTMLNNICISDGTKELLRSILCKIPQFRLKASEAVEMVSTLLALQSSSQNPNVIGESKSFDQIVPECSDFNFKDQQESKPQVSKSYRVAPDIDEESESEKTEKSCYPCEVIGSEPGDLPPKAAQQTDLLHNKEVKVAMLRLGATSVNSINALSFSYPKKNSCRS